MKFSKSDMANDKNKGDTRSHASKDKRGDDKAKEIKNREGPPTKVG